MAMTDTEILDFLEASIEVRRDDVRWGNDYLCQIGKTQFVLGPSQPLSFRELVEQAALKQITYRLKS